MTAGFRIAIRNYREKTDQSGRVKLSKITPKVPGRTVKSLHAEAKRTEDKLRDNRK